MRLAQHSYSPPELAPIGCTQCRPDRSLKSTGKSCKDMMFLGAAAFNRECPLLTIARTGRIKINIKNKFVKKSEFIDFTLSVPLLSASPEVCSGITRNGIDSRRIGRPRPNRKYHRAQREPQARTATLEIFTRKSHHVTWSRLLHAVASLAVSISRTRCNCALGDSPRRHLARRLSVVPILFLNFNPGSSIAARIVIGIFRDLPAYRGRPIECAAPAKVVSFQWAVVRAVHDCRFEVLLHETANPKRREPSTLDCNTWIDPLKTH
jgi:hypothetical protein